MATAPQLKPLAQDESGWIDLDRDGNLDMVARFLAREMNYRSVTANILSLNWYRQQVGGPSRCSLRQAINLRALTVVLCERHTPEGPKLVRSNVVDTGVAEVSFADDQSAQPLAWYMRPINRLALSCLGFSAAMLVIYVCAIVWLSL